MPRRSPVCAAQSRRGPRRDSTAGPAGVAAGHATPLAATRRVLHRQSRGSRLGPGSEGTVSDPARAGGAVTRGPVRAGGQ